MEHEALVQQVVDSMDTPVYVCEVVHFVAEFRHLLSPSRVWAICEYSEYMIGHRLLNANQSAEGTFTTLVVEDVQVPPEFVEQVFAAAVFAAAPKDEFCVVDVGLSSSTGEWCVVECNPPFALSSYDLDMTIYVSYCTQAWRDMIGGSTRNQCEASSPSTAVGAESGEAAEKPQEDA